MPVSRRPRGGVATWYRSNAMYTIHVRPLSTSAQELFPLARRVTHASFAWDAHGCAEATITARLTLPEMLTITDTPAVVHVIGAWNGIPIWNGRLERPRIQSRAGTLTLTAAGYWRAFSDDTYTQVWYDTRQDRWRPLTLNERADAVPDRGEFRTQENGIYMAPRKNAIFGNTGTNKALYWGYQVPAGSRTGVIAMGMNGSLVAPNTNWTLELWAASSTWANVALIQTWTSVNGTLSLLTPLTWTPARTNVFFRLYTNTPDAAFAGETGSVAFTMGGPSFGSAPLMSGISATATTNLVAMDIVDAIRTLNGSQISGLQGNAAPLFTGLSDATTAGVYIDADPGAVMDAIAEARGNQIWVNLAREVMHEPRYSAAQTWRVAAADLTTERRLDATHNHVTVAYRTPTGDRAVTATATDADSVARYIGLDRRTVIAIDTINPTAATNARDAALADQANPIPPAAIRIRQLADAQQLLAPLHSPRPRDLIEVVNVLPGLSADLTRALTFRVGRTTLTLRAGQPPELQIEPATPIPQLETLLAQLTGV